MVWPASRAMLHFALNDVDFPEGAVVLEIGAGTGVTAIGLARERAPPIGKMVATDACQESLANCARNAEANGVQGTVSVAHWDIADGAIPAVEGVTHVLAADVVYHGAEGDQLLAALARLLRAHPSAHTYVIAVDRFGGGAVVGLSQVAGVNPEVRVGRLEVDPAVRALEEGAGSHGLELTPLVASERAHADLARSLGAWERLWWALWDVKGGLRLYRVQVLQDPG